jgi:hypothetical protein
MRLVELDPKWVMRDGIRVGFTFFSPVRSPGPIHWRQSCFVVSMTAREQWALFEDENVQHCNPRTTWTVLGGIEKARFETLTVHPSIDGSAGGLWHGFIRNGMIS